MGKGKASNIIYDSTHQDIAYREKNILPINYTSLEKSFFYKDPIVWSTSENILQWFDVLVNSGLIGDCKHGYMSKLWSMARYHSGKRTDKRQELADMLLAPNYVVDMSCDEDTCFPCIPKLIIPKKVTKELVLCLKEKQRSNSCIPCDMSFSLQEAAA